MVKTMTATQLFASTAGTAWRKALDPRISFEYASVSISDDEDDEDWIAETSISPVSGLDKSGIGGEEKKRWLLVGSCDPWPSTPLAPLPRRFL